MADHLGSTTWKRIRGRRVVTEQDERDVAAEREKLEDTPERRWQLRNSPHRHEIIVDGPLLKAGEVVEVVPVDAQPEWEDDSPQDDDTGYLDEARAEIEVLEEQLREARAELERMDAFATEERNKASEARAEVERMDKLMEGHEACCKRSEALAAEVKRLTRDIGQERALAETTANRLVREREDARAEVERLTKEVEDERTYAEIRSSELARLRASKPLSTDVLRDPPDELKATVAAWFSRQEITNTDQAFSRAVSFLARLADFVESRQHLLDSQSPPEQQVPPAGCGTHPFESACCSRGTKSCVVDHDSPSPAVGLTVGDGEAMRRALQQISATAPGSHHAVAAQGAGDPYRAACHMKKLAQDALAAVSEGADDA